MIKHPVCVKPRLRIGLPLALGFAAWILGACSLIEGERLVSVDTVDDLRQCVRDEVNQARGHAHQSVLGELAVAHCGDEIYRFARTERMNRDGSVIPEQVSARARQLEAELRLYALRYALGVEG